MELGPDPCCLLAAKSSQLLVKDSDYLRILQGGYFIDFVCMVTDRGNKISVIKTENFRLKVQKMFGFVAQSV